MNPNNDDNVDPLVTVVIATHNRAKLLERAVNSILQQTCQTFEIIIVNDASIDNTQEVIGKLVESDSRIKAIHSTQNVGPGAARNMGIKQAKGEFIAVLDDDDIANLDRLEIQVKELQSDPALDLVFSSVEFIDDELNTFEISPDLVYQGKFPEDNDEIFRLLYVERNYIPNTTIMTRKSIWKRFAYPEEPWIGEDRFLCCQLAASGVKINAISSPLVKVRRVQDMDSLVIKLEKDYYKEAIKLVKKTKAWLDTQGITKFNHLYNKAVSNRLSNGSKLNCGFKKFLLLAYALILDPNNNGAKRILKQELKIRINLIRKFLSIKK